MNVNDTTRRDQTENAPDDLAADDLAPDGQANATDQDALKEASRLGQASPFLVETDMEDIDQRQDGDGEDGRPSPMANADNPER